MHEVSAAPGPLTIAFGIDNRFAVPLAATLHSLLDGLSGEERPHLYILSQDVTDANKHRLSRVVGHRAHLHWLTLARLPVDPALLTTPDYLSVATYYRVFLLELLPPACRKVLYLDADVIVQGDVRALWEQDVGDHVLLAVRDAGVFNVASPSGILPYEALGLPPEAPYFNGGVLLIDLDKWRRARMTQRFLEYTEAYGAYSRFADQDGLNAILHGRWAPLDERWNLQKLVTDGQKLTGTPDRVRYVAALREELDNLTAGAFIIHYSERRKPWHPRCTHPFRRLFHEHFQQSGCFQSRSGYIAWYACRYAAWLSRKLIARRTWSTLWKKIDARTSHGVRMP